MDRTDITKKNGGTEEIFVPACHGKAFRVEAGETFRIVDVEGQQAGDMIVFCQKDMDEVFSPAHTRSCQNSTALKVGDCLFSNKRTPLLEIVHDTVGYHDLLVPCCDPWRYQRDYGIEHRSCQDNLLEGLEELGINIDRLKLPEAVNIFMKNVVDEKGTITTLEPQHSAGSYIEFKSLEDVLVVLSACPQDLSPCNAYHPSAMKVVIHHDING